MQISACMFIVILFSTGFFLQGQKALYKMAQDEIIIGFKNDEKTDEPDDFEEEADRETKLKEKGEQVLNSQPWIDQYAYYQEGIYIILLKLEYRNETKIESLLKKLSESEYDRLICFYMRVFEFWEDGTYVYSNGTVIAGFRDEKDKIHYEVLWKDASVFKKNLAPNVFIMEPKKKNRADFYGWIKKQQKKNSHRITLVQLNFWLRTKSYFEK